MNIFLTRNHFVFEEALELALLDIETGVNQTALVGTVDECIVPLAYHRQQLRIEENTPLGEGTHWWLIGKENAISTPPLAEIIGIKIFNQWSTLDQYLESLFSSFAYMPVYIACGAGLSSAAFETLSNKSECIKADNYSARSGYYESMAGHILSGIINDHSAFPNNTLFLHIDQNRSGNFSCIALKRP